MATGLLNPSSPSLRLATPPSRSAPPTAVLRVGHSLGPSSQAACREPRRRSLSRGVGGAPGRRRLAVCCGVATVDQARFPDEVLKSEVPVLVEFVADWCGPCRLIAPVIEWASQEYDDKLKIVKIDHDANPQLIEQYKVYGLPALILFKNGQEVPESRREGAVTKAKLKDYLDSLLESTAVA